MRTIKIDLRKPPRLQHDTIPYKELRTYEDFKRYFEFSKYLTSDEIQVIDKYVRTRMADRQWQLCPDGAFKKGTKDIWIFASMQYMLDLAIYSDKVSFLQLLVVCSDQILSKSAPKSDARSRAFRKWLKKNSIAYSRASSSLKDSTDSLGYDKLYKIIFGMTLEESRALSVKLDWISKRCEFLAEKYPQKYTLYLPEFDVKYDVSPGASVFIWDVLSAMIVEKWIRKTGEQTMSTRLPHEGRVALAHFLWFWKLIDIDKTDDDPLVKITNHLNYLLKKDHAPRLKELRKAVEATPFLHTRADKIINIIRLDFAKFLRATNLDTEEAFQLGGDFVDFDKDNRLIVRLEKFLIVEKVRLKMLK
jgi:hypothetical protein